jgi:putative DNA primase/helicase
VYEAQTGWTQDKKRFVLVDGVIGNAATKIIGVNRVNSINDPSGRLSRSGSWKSWRDTVAEQAHLSTILMFGICVALAATLLAIINRPSFSIFLFGRTRVGKSIATLLGASIIGIARIDDLITWNIKDARLEERISEFNDALFPIDDLSNMKGSDKEKYLRIRDVAYRISQGWSTARHSLSLRPMAASMPVGMRGFYNYATSHRTVGKRQGDPGTPRSYGDR